MFPSIRWRKAKSATLTLTLTFYSGGEEKEGKYSEKENIFFSGGKENQRRKRRKIFGGYLSSILRSLGYNFGLETFANFQRVSVSVSENLVLEKSLGFGFGEFGLGKKSLTFVSKNWVSEEKSRYRFRSKFCIGKKSLYWFW